MTRPLCNNLSNLAMPDFYAENMRHANFDLRRLFGVHGLAKYDDLPMIITFLGDRDDQYIIGPLNSNPYVMRFDKDDERFTNPDKFREAEAKGELDSYKLDLPGCKALYDQIRQHNFANLSPGFGRDKSDAALKAEKILEIDKQIAAKQVERIKQEKEETARRKAEEHRNLMMRYSRYAVRSHAMAETSRVEQPQQEPEPQIDTGERPSTTVTSRGFYRGSGSQPRNQTSGSTL